MELSFYAGASGAQSSLKKLSVVSNNLANINNDGFKPGQAEFRELVTQNLTGSENEKKDVHAGSGTRVVDTATDFSVGALKETGKEMDFALPEKNAFFAVQIPGSDAVHYTRTGRFHKGVMPDGLYLLTDENAYVLDKDNQPIRITEDENVAEKISVRAFDYLDHLVHEGGNRFSSPDDDHIVEKPQIIPGFLEGSGVNMAGEAVKMIEAQRAYGAALKIVQVSDEIVGTVNSLRG